MYKEKFVALADAVGKKPENAEKVTSMIELNMEHLVDYVKAVYMMEVTMQLQRARLGEDSREYAEKLAELDHKRRSHHECAIAAVSVVNRMCGIYGVESIFDGNLDDRYEVADFCGNLVDEIFGSRDKIVAKDVLAKAREK